MPVIGVSITKSVEFQGQQNRFSNVYHVSFEQGVTIAPYEIVDYLRNREAVIHGGVVEFVEGRVYEIEGTAAENKTLAIIDLDGFGQATTAPGMYRECAVLVKFPLPRKGDTGRKRQLTKWLHLCASPGITGGDYGESGAAWLNPAFRDAVRRAMDPLLTPGIIAGGTLTSPDGTLPTGISVHPYLEHRQFHRGPQRIKNGQVL